MSLGRRFRRSTRAATLAAAAVIAGCGGGDDDGGPTGEAAAETTTAGHPVVPEPTQPLSEQIQAFERASAGSDCAPILQVLHPIELTHPEQPRSNRNCEGAVRVMARFRDFHAGGSEELGTGAIVDGRSKGRELALVWALDEDGQFKFTGSYSHGFEAGTEPKASFEQSATAFVAALRDDDCRAAFETLAPASRLSYGDEKTFCKQFGPTFTDSPENLGSRLQKDLAAEPVDLGATSNWGFFGLATEPAGYRTLVVVGSLDGGAPALWDAIPLER